MKVALVHDYLREYGGAERVVEVLHEIYPQAPLYTAFVDWENLGSWGKRFSNWDIRTSWVQKFPLIKKWHSPLRFLTPLIWESFNLKEYDVIISSSGWYICRGVITGQNSIHISYIHHPPRNLYGFPTGTKPNLMVKIYASIINPFLRAYDFSTAQRVDYLVANSKTTETRINKFYRRDAEVIYPPVNLLEFRIKNNELRIKEKYYLSVGRLNWAKRIDLAIEACNKLQLPLKIVGIGKEIDYLKQIAGSTIEFLGAVDDREINKLYEGARALIFCALEEDFGMVPVEAMGHGVPVVALRQGGVMETVVDGKTGVFFDQPEVSELVNAINKFEKMEINSIACIKQAQKFSKEVFVKKIKDFVEEKYNKNKY
jgi:glycosyltransferase involved in cell wall biosynthesis